MAELVVKTMLGLGDNIWSRPFVAALARVYSPLTLVTPWPQIYQDFAERYELMFARPHTHLRTQQLNIERWKGRWVATKQAAFRLRYSAPRVEQGLTLYESFEESARPWLRAGTRMCPGDIQMDVPTEWLWQADQWIEEWTLASDVQVILVRPPTLRKEWYNSARNCDPIALQWVIDRVKWDQIVVGVAHLRSEEEWLAEPRISGFHHCYFRGELGVEALVGLSARCRSVGSVGFMLPLALATRGRHFALFGGNYGLNSPEKLLHPGYGLGRVGFVEPDHPCLGCTNAKHACSTSISLDRLDSRFEEWLTRA